MSGGYPGFNGVKPTPRRRSGSEEDGEEPYIFHFPDGNASIARLLVRSLIPGSAPGNTMEDIVTELRAVGQSGQFCAHPSE